MTLDLESQDADTREQYLVVWTEDGHVFSLTDTDGKLVRRDLHELKRNTYSVLSTAEEVPDMVPGKRYAVSVELAAEYFGWDLE